jgi:molybdopterin molybdotransferase
MLTVDEARARVLATVARTPAERIPLANALGRVAALAVQADVDLPLWDNSAMDGYAVRASDLATGGTSLRLLETVPAGGWPVKTILAGCASAVMTGAPLPEGADAVVMVEDTDGSLEGVVEVRSVVAPGTHVRRRGSDVARGQVIIEAGTTLSAGAIGLLGALGAADVAVARRPRVGLLTTGDEVVAPGVPLQPGQIWSANHLTLAALVAQAGGQAVDLGIAPDDEDAVVAAVQSGLQGGCDLVVTTGGVSVGAFDVVKGAFERLGGAVDFWKVKMKPGKPFAFALAGRVPLFGLPGNPVSCMVNFLEFVHPWIRHALGAPQALLPTVHATALDAYADSPGRETFVRVMLERLPEGYGVRLAGGQGSHALGAMARAHGLARLPAAAAGYAVGDRVEVEVFDIGALFPVTLPI